jgi:hypothetical protein
MVSATVEAKPHKSHGSAKYDWNLCRVSTLHYLCMLHVRRMTDNLAAHMNQEQDEDDSRHHAMDVVELEAKSRYNGANDGYHEQTCLVIADTGDYCRQSAKRVRIRVHKPYRILCYF